MSTLEDWVDDPQLVTLTLAVTQSGLVGANMCNYLKGHRFAFREGMVRRGRSLQVVPSVPVMVNVVSAGFRSDGGRFSLEIELDRSTRYAPERVYSFPVGVATRVNVWHDQVIVVAPRADERYLVLEFVWPRGRKSAAA